MKPTVSTIWLLMAQYDGQLLIPLERVCSDYFNHMSMRTLIRETENGSIPLPVTRMTDTQKAPRMVHINDLADYIDRQAETARREAMALAS